MPFEPDELAELVAAGVPEPVVGDVMVCSNPKLDNHRWEVVGPLARYGWPVKCLCCARPHVGSLSSAHLIQGWHGRNWHYFNSTTESQVVGKDLPDGWW
jgi:hypothetical protein